MRIKNMITWDKLYWYLDNLILPTTFIGNVKGQQITIIQIFILVDERPKQCRFLKTNTEECFQKPMKIEVF